MSEERKHSVLAPSSKEWIHCGYSAKFLAEKEEETNEASEFGTECHALAEAYIKQSLKIDDFDEAAVDTDSLKSSFKHYGDEMEWLASGYSAYFIQAAEFEEKRTGKKPIVFVEQLLDMDYAPDTHGTADGIIIAGDTLTIIDNKTGFIPVHTHEEDGALNSQLAIYALYAYEAYKNIYPITKVRLCVYQERIHNIDECELEVSELLRWKKDVLIPAAKEALNPNAEPRSGLWCKYCPGRNVCRRRSEDAMKVDTAKEITILSDDEIEEILGKADFVIDYCNSVKDYALKKAIEGKKWKGFTLSESITKRKISNEEKVKEILKREGFCPEITKLMSITELQKLVGKNRFNELVGEYVVKPKGQPILIKETNKKEK